MIFILYFAYLQNGQSFVETKDKKIKMLNGMVIALETPLFSRRDINSKIYQYIRKNDLIYIHAKHKGYATFDQSYKEDAMNRSYQEEIDRSMKSPEDNSFKMADNFIEKRSVPINPTMEENKVLQFVDQDHLFYQTVDKIGRTAFVLRKHIKLIHQDTREFEMSANPYDYDEMDYRLEEPLPEKYPLFDKKLYRISFGFGFGPEKKSNYQYADQLNTENFNSRAGFEASIVRMADFDQTSRYFFGVFTSFYRHTNDFSWANQIFNAREFHEQYAIGPNLTYDAYKTENWLVSFLGGINYLYEATTLIQVDGQNLIEERYFSGFTFAPHIGSLMHRKNIIFDTGFFMKFNMQLNLPFSQNSADPIVNQKFWNTENDQIAHRLGGEINFSIGAMSPF
jgi:hypothetical protein